MKINTYINMQRLVAKVDNDFNISESDWIPRCAAWVIDALSQMKCLPRERKKRTLEVTDKIATFPCKLDASNIKVYDKNGCEIEAASDSSTSNCSCNNSSTGGSTQTSEDVIAIIDDTNTTGTNFMRVASVISNNSNRNFVVSGNSIELNFDADSITVETNEVATYHDDYFNCEVPYIYDDGLLLEALAWYILFKYLSRGSHHPVYDLKSNSPVTNPYLQWNTLRPKAAASAKAKMNKDAGWRNFFYNSTFDPRNN